MNHQAIYNLYPNVVSIDDGSGALDSSGNKVDIDIELVSIEELRLASLYKASEYQRLRSKEYPPITDYLDGVVKGDQAQIDKYIADCQAVKAKYPKGS